MMKAKRILRDYLYALLALVMFAFSTSSVFGDEKVLNIGAVLMQSGPASAAGLAWARGYKVMVDKVNDAGGIKIGNDTYKIKLTVADDAMSTEQAASATMKLVEQDKCTIIFGSLNTAMELAEYPITFKAGALLLDCGTAISGQYKTKQQADVGSDRPLKVRPQATSDNAIPGLLDYLRQKYPAVKKIAITGITEDMTTVLNSITLEEMRKRGLAAAGGIEYFAPDIQDYTPIMTRVLMKKPDAIFCINGGPIALGSQTKAARELGFKGPIFTIIKGDIELQARIAGSNTSDIFARGFTLSDENLPQGMKDFKSAFLKTFSKNELVSDAAYAYQNMWSIIQAIEKANSVDPAAIQSAYESMCNPGDIKSIFGSTAHSGGLKTVGVNRAVVEPFAISLVTKGVAKVDKWVTYEFP